MTAAMSHHLIVLPDDTGKREPGDAVAEVLDPVGVGLVNRQAMVLEEALAADQP
jgi:hypothetical protein